MLFEALNSLISTKSYAATGHVYVPILIGAGFCLVSLLAGVAILRKIKNKKRRERNN